VSLHPQVEQLLERAAKSPLPLLHEVPAHVARRIYRDTRAALAPRAPEVAEARLLIAPGPVALRYYRPQGARADEQLPALVYFHGGGWVIGDLDTHDVLCRQLANGARCAVYSVDYRMGPEFRFPAAVEDCVAATRFVAGRHKTIALGGDSAGGNLAAVVALHARDAGAPKIAFQLLIYPATDQRAQHPSIRRNGEGYLLTKKAMDYFQAQYLPRKEDLLDWRASPLLATSLAGLPPAYLITAGYDPLLDEGREYAERMAREGVEVAYREYPDMVHGFILFGGVLDAANAAVAECCEKLRASWRTEAHAVP
jgi:acetyl esterase